MDLTIDRIIETKRRNICLIIENHKFRKVNHLKNGNICFFCTNKCCRASVVVNEKLSKVIEAKSFPHNHPPLSNDKVILETLRTAVKKKAEEDVHVTPHKVIVKAVQDQGAINDIKDSDIRLLRKSMYAVRKNHFPVPMKNQEGSCHLQQDRSISQVPQQAPPGTKQVVPPTPPLKKSLPPASQPSPKPVIVKQAPSRPVSPPQPPPPPPEVCLRWNSYHSNMQATFPSLLNNEQFVDVTLACEGRSIKCHKMMLSACSSYFEELLSQNPCQHPIVLMKDLKFWEVQALVDFMYRGEVNVGQDKLPSLLAAAEALQIKGLAGPASTSSSHDEDSLPPSLPLAAEDYLDESASSPSSARRARKRRTLASMPTTTQQNTVTPLRSPMGRPRLVRPSPQPSTSSYVASEPPLRRARRSEPTALPVGEIKIEPVDIDISNDSLGNDSMDPIDDGFDMKKNFEDIGRAGEGNNSSQRTDEPDSGGGGGGDHEMTGSMCDDNSALITGHDSDLDYGNNNGMTTEQADTGATDDQNSEIQGYSYTDGSDGGGPGMSSSDINPSYPEVVLNPDNASSDSILGHM